MKLMFASDIHGSRSACEAVLAAYRPRARSVWFCWAIFSITVRATICRTHMTRRA